MAENNLIMYLALSIMLNIIILFFIIGTKIGRECYTRFRNKIKFKSGKYVNSVMCLKTGVIKEVFSKKNDEGKFRFDNQSYVTSPRLRMPYNGIPTYLHIEGSASPVDIFSKENELLSSAEMDNVMMAANNFDLQEFLKKNLPIILLAIGAIAIGLIAVAYFDYMTYQMLRDGSYEAARGAVSILNPK